MKIFLPSNPSWQFPFLSLFFFQPIFISSSFPFFRSSSVRVFFLYPFVEWPLQVMACWMNSLFRCPVQESLLNQRRPRSREASFTAFWYRPTPAGRDALRIVNWHIEVIPVVENKRKLPTKLCLWWWASFMTCEGHMLKCLKITQMVPKAKVETEKFDNIDSACQIMIASQRCRVASNVLLGFQFLAVSDCDFGVNIFFLLGVAQ